MKSSFVTNWKKSVMPRKQRKYVYNSPLHIRGKFFGATLSKDLRAKYSKRTLRVVKGDKVKVMRGNFAGKTGVVDKVDLQKINLFIEGIAKTKHDGSKSLLPINPSNVMIIELNLNDKIRRTKLEGRTKELKK